MVESRFLQETVDLDAGLLGLNDSTVGCGRQLYSTTQGDMRYQN